MNIIQTIKKRKSCRTFNMLHLTPADKKDLENYLLENSEGIEDEIAILRIVEKIDADKQMKLNYGMIQGHNTYILGTAKSIASSRVNYGYLMEKVVLKATAMNLSTCWIGYFDSTYFNEITLEDGFEIPSIVIIGYSDDKQTYQDKFVRFSIRASKRQSWQKLFFNYKLKTPLKPDDIKKYSDSFEMVRLAPSSGNTQPWRVYFDDNTNELDPRDLPEHHRMGTGSAWPAACGPPLFRSRTPGADAGRNGLPGRDHPRADQVPELIRARHAGAWAAFADRRAAGEAAVRGCDRRGGISASARRTHRRGQRQAGRMIGGEWKRAPGDRQTPLIEFRLYRTPVGVISGVIVRQLRSEKDGGDAIHSWRTMTPDMTPTGMRYSLNYKEVCRSPGARLHSPPINLTLCRWPRRWGSRALADIPPRRWDPRTAASPAARR